MANKLHLDIETYSSIDITSSGAYKYCESIDFEILMVAYAYNDEPIVIVDLAQGEKLPNKFIMLLLSENVEKHAHNANFERNCFKAIGYDVPVEQWHCSAIKAAYCGFPLGLAAVSEAMKLEEKGKLATGKSLIRIFSCPVKPTAKNDYSQRNHPTIDLEKWNEYKRYCVNDVEAEREIIKRLEAYTIPWSERLNYILDQQINDRGILIDISFAQNAYAINEQNSQEITRRLTQLTGLGNPNSPAQLKKWLSFHEKKEIKSLNKEFMPILLEETGSDVVREVLSLRSKGSKTSIEKYVSMQNCVCENGRAHGLFQFYGANRTGRWAGRLIQMQNLRQNHLTDLDNARQLAANTDYDTMSLVYDDISDVLSQLIRTAFVAKPGHTFVVADFSAIEARVIAWLANEKWRMDVFKTHGKIYEASASMMFDVPIEEVTKGSSYRNKGKVAELALGYQGAVGALQKMGGEEMGLSELEMKTIVTKWRAKSPCIVALWASVENNVIRAIKTRKKIILSQSRNLAFEYDGKALTIELPSGRKLFYQDMQITINKFGKESVKYKGVDQLTKKWWWVDSYGGKFVENIVQAIARDLLAEAMQSIDERGYKIVMHVHDEVVCEVLQRNALINEQEIFQIMSMSPTWAKDLPLTVDGYSTNYYKKD